MGAGQSDLYKGTFGDKIENIPDILKENNSIIENPLNESDVREKYIGKIGKMSPEEMYKQLVDDGCEVKPLSRGQYKGVSFNEGGGFKINFGDDGLFQYHPEGIHHNGGSGYYKLSTGYSGTIRFDLNGNILGD